MNLESSFLLKNVTGGVVFFLITNVSMLIVSFFFHCLDLNPGSPTH